MPKQVNTANAGNAGLIKNRLKASVLASAIVATLAVGVMVLKTQAAAESAEQPASPTILVSQPLVRDLDTRLEFLGQFAAVDELEIRAQVGGTLQGIHFQDGDIVEKGALLFEIDPVPYEIKLSQATAKVEVAKARFELATRELERANMLRETDAGSAQNVDQKEAEQREAKAVLDEANALVRDARFDLDRTHITAPFTGRIGTHLVSLGNLIAGSRAGTSPTTLLATLVSTDPIYLNFDLSEADHMALVRAKQGDSPTNEITIALSDETTFDRKGTLTFIDNSLDRSSGTIHARATVANPEALMTPGAFARVKVAISSPAPTLLIPDAAVMPDQSEFVVLTVNADNVVMPKKVEVGALRGGLRVIRGGLTANDRVVIEGFPTVAPGSTITPQISSIEFGSDQE